MAAFRFSRSDESQVDPFNAGEPEMPGGEPDFLAEDDEPEVEYAAHGEPGGTPHKPEDNYQAPTTRSHDYDARWIEGAAAPAAGPRVPRLGQQWQRAALGRCFGCG